MNETAEFVIRHGYAVLFCWILAEQAALPIPSVPLLLVCGALEKAGHLNAAAIIASGLIAALLGDSIWFEAGRRRGASVLGRLCRMSLEPDSCVRQTESKFASQGPRLLLVSKFIPGVSALAAPLAGASRTSWKRFLLFDAAGTLIWIVSWCFVGWLFSEQLDRVGDVVGRAGFRLFLFVVALLAAWIGWKYVQRKLFMKKLNVARISTHELRRMLEDGEGPVIIDVRGLHASDSPIAGAVRIPLSEIEARHNEIPRDRDVILFCT